MSSETIQKEWLSPEIDDLIQNQDYRLVAVGCLCGGWPFNFTEVMEPEEVRQQHVLHVHLSPAGTQHKIMATLEKRSA